MHKHTCTPQFLDLENCGIGDEGCQHVRDLLRASTAVTVLDLQSCQISDVGCRLLAEGIRDNTTLQACVHVSTCLPIHPSMYPSIRSINTEKHTYRHIYIYIDMHTYIYSMYV